jgi:NADPH:quinone reductase
MTQRVVAFRAFGKPEDVLNVEERPLPEPGPGQVRVRLTHRSINPADLITIRGRYGARPELPATGGNEAAGFVDALGPGASGVAVGQRVVPLAAGPTWQEYLVASPDRLLVVPEGLADAHAAQLFVNPLTAYLMLTRELALPPGQWLFQNAAMSAVGRFTIQLAAHLGVRTINLVRRREQVEMLRQMGADEVIVQDEDDVAECISRVTDGKGVAGALDAVGGESGGLALGALGEQGTLVAYGALSGQPISIDGSWMIYRRASVRGFWRTRWYEVTPPEESRPVLEELAQLMALGVLQAPVDAEFDLADIHEAVRAATSSGRTGKILLTG